MGQKHVVDMEEVPITLTKPFIVATANWWMGKW